MNEYLDYEGVSALLNVPKGTMYALVSQKRVPHIRLSRRLVRFDRKELETWIAAHAVLPAQTNRTATPTTSRHNV